MTRGQKKLLLWSAIVMVVAVVAQRIQMGHTAAITVGAVEVVLAIATGIAFGLTVSRNDE